MNSRVVRERLSLRPGTSLVDDAMRLVVRMFEDQGADGETVQCMALAVAEAVGNAIRHAMSPGARHLELTCRVSRGDAVVEVIDHGPGFNFGRRPMPGPLADAGRGIPLMFSVCDDVRYEASPSGNRLLLRKRLRRRA